MLQLPNPTVSGRRDSRDQFRVFPSLPHGMHFVTPDRKLPEFRRVVPISASLSLHAYALNQGSFPPSALPDLSGTTSPSATPPRPSYPHGLPVGHALGHVMGFPVLRALSLCTCCHHYPGTATGGTALLIQPVVSAFPGMAARSARASSFSRFARCSLTLRPAHLRCHHILWHA